MHARKMAIELYLASISQVATPVGSIRPTREQEQQEAQVSELSRANELFEKRDFLAALAEYEVAVTLPHVRLFALVNRGNAFKSRKAFAEASTCYEDALDLATLDSVEGRLLHACVLNNIGANCLEAKKLDQASVSAPLLCGVTALCSTKPRACTHRPYSCLPCHRTGHAALRLCPLHQSALLPGS
jgi:Tfp pilus assembly protein PilF